MHFRFLAEVHDASQEIEKSLEALEALKELDQLGGTQLFVVFSSNLNADLQVLSKIGGQHGFQTFQTVIDAERTKVLYQPLWLEKVGVHDGPLDVEDVGVVLQSTLEKLGLFTKLGNVGSVVVGEHLVPKNSVGYLRFVENIRDWRISAVFD